MALDTSGRECILLPAFVNSFGVWENLFDPRRQGKKIWDYSLPLLEMFIVVISFSWQFLHFFLKHLGFLKFTSQMIAGFLLSFITLDQRSGSVFFPEDYRKNVIGTMGAFGYTMFWFLMGVKMDVGMIFATGTKAMAIGVSSVLGPFLLSSLFFWKKISETGSAGKNWIGENLMAEDMVVIPIQSIGAFPVIASLLIELKIQNSELGRLGLAAAVVSDLLGVSLAVLLNLGVLTYQSTKKAMYDAAAMLTFLISIAFLVRPAMLWIVRQTPEGKPVKDIYIYSIIVGVFMAGAYLALFDQFLPFGPFIFGLAVPHGPPLGAALTQKFESFTIGAFLPFFVATCAMKVEMTNGLDKDAVFLVAAISLIKFLSSVIPALVSKMPVWDAIALAIVMSHKGIVELSAYAFALDQTTIKHKTFATVAIFIMLNSLLSPILLILLYNPRRKFAGYQRRDMIHLKANSELRILACIHQPDNITPMINLLDVSCPTRENPIAVYVLHLVELVGQASPIFISHQMQSRKVGNNSYSDNVIISFNQFKRDRWGSVHVSTFTSISAPKQMDEDICMLALDNLTSIIVLPFHRRWSVDGSTIVSDSNMIRTLNCNVLERAPCSVGILVDRSRLGRRTTKDAVDTSYQVCMIFCGGKDDREALTLAKRIARDSRLNLTVVRFISMDDTGVTDWDTMLDSAELKDVKQNNVSEEYVIYIEEMVKDGTETATVLRTMVQEYDLLIVGRTSGMNTSLTKGLEEWTELSELGIIGDLLASPDLDSKCSVLVVQHQKHMT